jgi:replicative DNA helicase
MAINKHINEEINGYQEYLKELRDGKIIGLKTGWKKFDNAFYGIRKDRQFIIGAQPAQGKSSFINNLILCLCKNNDINSFYILYLNFEMSNYDQITRFICTITNMEEKEIIGYNTDITDERIIKYNNALEILKQYPINFIDEPIDFVKIETEIINIQKNNPNIHIILCLDHIGLAKSVEKGIREQTLKLSRDLAYLKKKYQLTNFIISQLNRDTLSKEREYNQYRPEKKDLKESGNIESDADIIILLHNPYQFDVNWKMFTYGDMVSTKNKIRAIIAKNRRGKQSYIDFEFIAEKSFIKEL